MHLDVGGGIGGVGVARAGDEDERDGGEETDDGLFLETGTVDDGQMLQKEAPHAERGERRGGEGIECVQSEGAKVGTKLSNSVHCGIVHLKQGKI